VSCHEPAPDGRFAAVFEFGDGYPGIAAADGSLDIAPRNLGNGNFMAWSPDMSELLVTMTGELRVVDLASQDVVGALGLTGHTTQVAASPDGTRIAWNEVLTDAYYYDFELPEDANTEIKYADWSGGLQLGAVRSASGRAPSDTLFCTPRWTPDSQWLLWGVSEDGRCYGDHQVTSRLQLVGTNTVFDLPQIDNNYVRFATDDEGGTWALWVSRSPSAMIDGRTQVMMSWLDLEAAEQGVIPETPAFRVPGFNPLLSYDLPVWAP
jgi:hypothetical protein